MQALPDITVGFYGLMVVEYEFPEETVQVDNSCQSCYRQNPAVHNSILHLGRKLEESRAPHMIGYGRLTSLQARKLATDCVVEYGGFSGIYVRLFLSRGLLSRGRGGI